MKTATIFSAVRALAVPLLFLSSSTSLSAALHYTWSGPAAGGSWDDPANWTISGGPEDDKAPVPVGRVGAHLNSTTVDRNVIYSGAKVRLSNGQDHANWLRDITIIQNAPSTNQLTFAGSLHLGNNLVLAAANRGSSRLVLHNGDIPPFNNKNTHARKITPTIRFEMGYAGQPDRQLTIKAGGLLDFSGTVYDDGNNAASITRGNVILDGGRILLRRGGKAGSNASVSYNINGQLSIHAGEMEFGAPNASFNSRREISDVRLGVGNGFTMTGGRLVNSGGSETKTLWLNGASNLVLAAAAIDPQIQIVLGANNDQTITSSIPLNDIQLRQSAAAVKTIAIHAQGPSIGGIVFIQSQVDAPNTLRLGSDLTLRSGAGLPQAHPMARPPAGSTVVYEIDTAGHTLDLTSNPAPWKPNRPANDITAHWRITGGGTIVATDFDFRSEGVTVTVSPGTTLRKAEDGNNLTAGN